MSWAKNLATTPNRILHEISYINLLLYAKATPDYGVVSKDEKEPEYDATLDANNPDNNPDKHRKQTTRVTKQDLLNQFTN